MRKIKVVHVITRFDKGGSAENTFLSVCGLDKTRYDVVLVIGGVSPKWHSGDPEVSAIKANVTAIREHQVRLIGLRHLERDLNLLSDIIAFFSLLHILWRERPHIVHTHTSKAGILGRWAAHLCRVPVILHTPHGHVFWGYFGRFQTRLFILLEKWTARITDAIVMLTPQEKEDHLHFGIAPEKKLKIIHSGVDIDVYSKPIVDDSEVRRGLNLPEGSFVVGTLGRLTAIKGHVYLLKAAVKILADSPDVFFVFVGDGELHDDLQRYAADRGIAGNVRFLGWRADVAPVLSMMDVFAFPSLNEGMGKALVEAMAMGKPIVASRIGGIPDLVTSWENGILVPPADETALAGAIKILYENEGKRREMGEKGRKKALAYGIQSMVDKIENLYASFCEGEGCVVNHNKA